MSQDASAPTVGTREKGGGEGAREHATQERTTQEDEAKLLYDDEADERDEAWMEAQHPGAEGERVACPGCFVTISFHAQAHTTFVGQFRALLVVNCETGGTVRMGELCMQRVSCIWCETSVGLVDSHGTFHFCNVLF